MDKQEILKSLSLINDERIQAPTLFQFTEFANQIAALLKNKDLPTPYSIALHGEWGGGKTSLLYRAFEILKSDLPNNNWKILWFDAWEYERLDPALALMQRIANEFKTKKIMFVKTLKGLVTLSSDIAARKVTGLTLNQLQKHFENSVDNIPTITEQLERMIGKSRLVVFIDDLDRCSNDNILNVLEAVKMLFNAKGAVFIFAVDISKLELAWELKYGTHSSNIPAAKDHVEKIFQLKLSLPPKEQIEIKKYVESLAPSLPYNESQLIIDGCPPNPRKIKRILNLIYFISTVIQDDFEHRFPLLIIWSIATVLYPELTRVIKQNPNSLVQMSLIANEIGGYDKFLSVIRNIEQPNPSGRVALGTFSLAKEQISQSAIMGLQHVINNADAFNFLKSVATYYSMKLPTNVSEETINSTLQRYYSEIAKPLTGIIYRAGLVG